MDLSLVFLISISLIAALNLMIYLLLLILDFVCFHSLGTVLAFSLPASIVQSFDPTRTEPVS